MTTAGLTVLLTRPEGRDEELARRLAAAGVRVLLAPAIRFEPVETALPAGTWDWLAVTSPTAAERLPAGGGASRVAALGDGTRRMLEARGIATDLVAPVRTGEGLARALLEAGAGPGTRVLHPTSDRPRPELRETLEAAGVEVAEPAIYRTRPAPVEPAIAAAIEADRVDAVVLASPSAVEGLLAGLPPAARERMRADVVAVAIGPTTAAAARDAGFARVVAAASPTTESLIQAIERRDPR